MSEQAQTKTMKERIAEMGLDPELTAIGLSKECKAELKKVLDGRPVSDANAESFYVAFFEHKVKTEPVLYRIEWFEALVHYASQLPRGEARELIKMLSSDEHTTLYEGSKKEAK